MTFAAVALLVAEHGALAEAGPGIGPAPMECGERGVFGIADADIFQSGGVRNQGGPGKQQGQRGGNADGGDECQEAMVHETDPASLCWIGL